MSAKYHYYEDPGHGWIKVPFHVLHELGIIDKITGYSYRKGDNAYLEEDCDASTFIDAYIAKHGNKPEFVAHFTNNSSRIRSYPGYWKK